MARLDLAHSNRAAVVIGVSAWESYVEELLRHEIAHGVNPRPVIHNAYSNWLPRFMRRLARCTDDAVLNHLTTTLGLANPWPP